MLLSKFFVFSCLIWSFSQGSQTISISGKIAKLIIDQDSKIYLEGSMKSGDIQVMNVEVEEGEFIENLTGIKGVKLEWAKLIIPLGEYMTL